MKGKKMKSKIGFLGITLLLVSGAFAAGQDIKDAPDGAAIKPRQPLAIATLAA